jgi:PIN domain nuclease of toxin-antitoxin system
MTVLLDSHTFFWWVTDNPRLSRRAHAAIENGAVHVSAVVAWEISAKVRTGKWPDASLLWERFFDVMERDNFSPLPLTLEHAHWAGSLEWSHRDPFDRMLAAQAQIEKLALVTADPVFRGFAVETIW